MEKKIRLVLCALILFLFAGGAVYSYAAQAKYHEYTNPKSPLLTHAGRKVLISLKSNKSVGGQWKLSKAPKKSVLQFLNVRYISAGSKLSGTARKEVWAFEAVGRGKAKVSFKCAGPAVKGRATHRHEIFTVIVK